MIPPFRSFQRNSQDLASAKHYTMFFRNDYACLAELTTHTLFWLIKHHLKSLFDAAENYKDSQARNPMEPVLESTKGLRETLVLLIIKSKDTAIAFTRLNRSHKT